MSVYYCQECDRYVDNDWQPCEEYEGELICPSCFEDLEDTCGGDGTVIDKGTKEAAPDMSDLMPPVDEWIKRIRELEAREAKLEAALGSAKGAMEVQSDGYMRLKEENAKLVEALQQLIELPMQGSSLQFKFKKIARAALEEYKK